jgi:hypothetical protein
MYDRLNKQANTLNGMWVRMTGEMEKNFAASGENMRSLGVAGIETLRGLGEAATDVLNGFDDIATGLADLVDDAGNAKRKMGDQSWWSRLRTGVITGTTMMYMDLTGQHDEFMEYAEQSAEIQRESERRKNQIAADKAVQDAKDAEDAMLEAEAEGYRKKIKKDMEAHQKSLDSKLSLEDQYQKEYAELTSKYMLWSAQDKFDAEMALRDKYDALIKEREDNARAERLKKDKEGLRELYEETSRWEEKQLADAKKANDEKLKEIDAKAKDDLQGFDQSNKASASFAAGSVEEYNLRRDMQLASRREAKEDAVNAAAQASRDQANRQLDALNRNIKAQADNERSAIQTTLAVIN